MTSPNLPKLPTLIRRLHIADDIKNKKRVQFTRLAAKYEVSRRTIYTDVNWILRNVDLEFLKNASMEEALWALGELHKRDEPEIILKYTMPFLAKAIPLKTEISEEVKYEEKITFQVTEDEDHILNEAARILDKRLSKQKDKEKSTKIH